MRINKDKPLPDHTKRDYYECCAKLILEELFPERYHDLVIEDKPDLQGEFVGIEVTRANEQKMEEARNNWNKAYHCQDEKTRDRFIERMAQLGVKYTGGVQVWPASTPSFDLIQEAVEKKVKKLTGGEYKPYERYELFVFTDTWFHSTVVETAKEYLFCNSVSEHYKTVFVLSQGADLHVFETKEGIHRNINLDMNEQSNRNIRARQLVEAAEESPEV